VDLSIEDSKEVAECSYREYHAYVLDNYLIVYPSGMNVETFSEEWFYGIIFRTEKGKFEAMHNYALGNRILLNFHDGSWHDIPFKPATFGFLPDGVEAIEIG
jgi:hypothetical protein